MCVQPFNYTLLLFFSATLYYHLLYFLCKSVLDERTILTYRLKFHIFMSGITGWIANVTYRGGIK